MLLTLVLTPGRLEQLNCNKKSHPISKVLTLLKMTATRLSRSMRGNLGKTLEILIALLRLAGLHLPRGMCGTTTPARMLTPRICHSDLGFDFLYESPRLFIV